MTNELYVTNIEQEAHDLTEQLALANVRSSVVAAVNNDGKPYWTVLVTSPLLAMDRALIVRNRMFRH